MKGRDVSKLFELKEWLTLADAAQHLSIIFGEEVREADVLRLALDGHLKLSVRFVNHATAQRGKVVPIEEAETFEIPKTLLKDKDLRAILGTNLGNGKILELDKKIVSIDGVWDLPMIGCEEIDVEHEYQNLTGGPAITLENLEGTFVERQDGTYCQLQESYDENEYQAGSKAHLRALKEYIERDNVSPSKAEELLERHKESRKKYLERRKQNEDLGKEFNNYYPAGGLPRDSVLVVRTSALQALQARIAEPDKRIEKPIESRERTTLLTIIAALAQLAKIDISKPFSAATSIESQTALMGVRVAARTIENHLNRIPEAMESRSQS